VARKQALALKARFTGDIIRYIIGTIIISRGYFFGLRTITELNRAFSAWLPGWLVSLGRCPG